MNTLQKIAGGLTMSLAVGAFASHEGLDGELLDQELLEPEVAFAASATAIDSQTLQIDFAIAHGYYLYHDKFHFTSTTDGIAFGDPLIPPGKVKKDEFFGEMETHRDAISIRIPYIADANSADSLTFQAGSQGCADIGVCYPPLKQNMTVSLATPVQTQGQTQSLSQLFSLTGSDGDAELLEPDRAFEVSVPPAGDNEITVEWAIADGYFMYRDKFQFTLEGNNGVRLGKALLPPGKAKNDPYFGQTHIFRDSVRARLPLLDHGVATEAVLNLTYQGCADLGVCYPPIKKQIPIFLTKTSTKQSSAPQTGTLSDSALSAGGGTGRPLAEQDRIAASLVSGDALLTITTFLGLGILLAFTPCVFPMVPILSSIIVGQGENIGARRAFGLSLIYVLAMAVTYTAAGVAVGLSGNNIQVWFQTPWVLISFALLFVLLSLSMFGFYELQMPSALQSRLTRWSNSRRGGTWLGVAMMGFLSALIVGPCITAPLVGALIYIAETGDAVLGGTALFALSIGMGIPLLMIGTSAGSLLPRAGAWMDAVKSVFGVLLLGLAIWMLERILPLAATMALSALLLITSGIYMRALEPLRDSASGWFTLWRALGITLLLYGVMLAVGAATGGTSFIHPLKGVFGTTAATSESQVPFQQIKGIDGLDTALVRTSGNNQTAMLDFYADWCISCKEMEAFTFSDPAVKNRLANTTLLQSDVTANDELDQALLRQIGIFGPPAILFFDKNGVEIANSRVVGFMSADRFAAHIDEVFAN